MTDPGVEYRNPSTFADYRCDLILHSFPPNGSSSHDSTTSNPNNQTSTTSNNTNSIIIYPCYYSGTGNAANTGDVGGVTWQCPIRIPNTESLLSFNSNNTQSSSSLYSWTVSFVTGTNIATTTYMSGAHGNPAEFFHEQTGTVPRDISDALYNLYYMNGKEHLSKSPSLYTGLEASDFLNYIDFDGISNSDVDIRRNTYSSCSSYVSNASMFIQNRPTWGGGRGRGIIGAITKIYDTTNVNVLYITTLSLVDHIYPFIEPYNDRLSYDISKLAQWEVAFQYAADIGVSIMLNLNEDTISDNEEQHLYVREMVARFGQYVTAYTVGTLQMAQYIRTLNGNQNITVLASILLRVDTDTEIVSLSENLQSVDGILLSMNNPSNISIYDSCKDWKQTNPQLSILVSAIIPTSTNTSQRSYSDLIWSTVFAGGAGVLIHPTRNSDDETEDGVMGVIDDDAFVLNDLSITTTRSIWDQRFTSMTTFRTLCNDILISDTDLYCLSDVTFTNIVIRIGSNSTDEVRVKEQFWFATNLQYSVEWIDLTTGILEITDITIISSNQTGLGTRPSATNDWIALLTCTSGCAI